VPFDEPTGVTVDEANGDVLVAEIKGIDVFEPTTLDQYALVRRLTGTPAGAFEGRSLWRWMAASAKARATSTWPNAIAARKAPCTSSTPKAGTWAD
jgi:hypothetical protein